MYKIKNSEISNLGIVSSEKILKDTKLGIWLTKSKTEGDRCLCPTGWYETPDLGRYCNHSSNPNTYFKMENDFTRVVLYCKETLDENTEITVDYMDAQKITGFKVNLSFINDKH